VVEPPAPRTVHLRTDEDLGGTLVKLKALASEPRLRILNLLGQRLYNVGEIASALGMHVSTATLHVAALEEAGLIATELRPARRGTQKVCTRLYGNIDLQLAADTGRPPAYTEVSVPIGSYSDFQVHPTCGLVSDSGIIGLLDDPASFYEPDRHDAQLLWFHHGYVEYRIPNRVPPAATLDSLSLSVEACSEAPFHHDDWPSDVTVWVNGTEIGTWTSPADFGGQRGKLTPEWWATQSTQFGLLKVWQVNASGSYVDGLRLSDVTVGDLAIRDQRHISVRIGVKETARHVGGINIFGNRFGNYPQDIVLRLRHS
jgi:predicted transcriptional regulator